MSLALDAKEKAIGVILSGAGHDGLLGSTEIENNNGVIFVQDPNTAEYPNMPESIIQSDMPNAVLSPEEISRRVTKYTYLNKKAS